MSNTASSDPPRGGLTYRDAGVDIDAGNALVERIKPAVRRTARPEVLGGLGGFGGLFALDPERYRHPVLVAGTDGVGTKLLLAKQAGRHEAIGIDLVAMCVNDVVAQGAEPLFFLDYYATAQLDVDVAAQVIEGAASACQRAGCALLGGETAEMPGMYAPGDYELAGFCVGAVERERLIDGGAISAGDAVIGLGSSGPHANGFSLIRRIVDTAKLDLDETLDGSTVADALLAPTRLYVKPVLALLEATEVHGLAHITGGGLPENLARILPEGLAIHLARSSWQGPPVFELLSERGGVDEAEMLRTFNNGIGFCAIVPAEHAQTALACADAHGLEAWQIGEVQVAAADQAKVRIED